MIAFSLALLPFVVVVGLVVVFAFAKGLLGVWVVWRCGGLVGIDAVVSCL